MPGPKLGYARKMQCVIHEIASNSPGVEDAEMIVAGYSLCSNCGQAALGEIIATGRPMTGMLNQAAGGRWEFP